MTVPLLCAKGVCPPSGQVKTSVPLSVVNTAIPLSSTPISFDTLHDNPDVIVELRHAGLVDSPADTQKCQKRFVLRRQMRDDVHAGRVQPQKERLVVGLRLVDKRVRKVAVFIINGFHPLRIGGAAGNDLFSRLNQRASTVGSSTLVASGIDNVTSTDAIQQVLRITRIRRVLHLVEMVRIYPKNWSKPCAVRQEFVLVAR